VEDREGTVAVIDGEGGVGSKAKVNVYSGCPVLSFKGSNLIYLPSCSNWHILD